MKNSITHSKVYILQQLGKALKKTWVQRNRSKCFVLIISCLTSLVATTAYTQHKQVDSLLAILQKNNTTAARKSALPALLEYTHSIHRDTLFEYAVEAYFTLRPGMPVEEKTRISMALAHAYMQWGWTDSAGHYLEEALQDSLQLSKTLLWELQRNYALVQGGNYLIKEALDILTKIASASSAADDWLTYASTANTIGSVYMATKDLTNAEKWIRLARDNMPNDKSPKGLATRAAMYTNIADLLLRQEKNQEAQQYIANAEELYRQVPNFKAQSFLQRSKAKMLLALRQTDSAEVAMQEVQKLQQALGIGSLFIDQNLFFAEFYKSAGYYDKAIEICLNNLENQTENNLTKDSASVLNNNLLTRLPYYEMLAELYKLTGQTKEYTLMLEKVLEGKELLYETNKAEELANLQAQYELSEKERLLALQKIDLLKKDFWLWSLGAAATLLLGAGLYRFAKYRRQKQAQLERVLQKAEAEKAAVMQAERQRIANDLHDNLGAYGAAIRHNLLQLQQKQDRSQHYMQELDNNVRHMVDELGNTIWVLHHAEKNLTDIYDKLKAWSSKILKSYPQIKCRFAEEGEGNIALSPVQSLQWLYIMQEVLNNALKHAEATQINVQLRQDTQSWEVQVQDNGKGLPEAIVEGNGLESIRNRCGKLGWLCSWSSVPHGGTRFSLVAKA